jgi:3-hydroxybutyryl-CoA dehydrogenase
VEIARVGVVGCGLMGSGIAEAVARAGVDVKVVDVDQSLVERGRERVETSISRAQKRALLTDPWVVHAA